MSHNIYTSTDELSKAGAYMAVNQTFPIDILLYQIMNTSSLSVQYAIKLDSQSLRRHTKAQGIPQFVQVDLKARSLVGAQNSSGAQVFDCVPAEGVIPAGELLILLLCFHNDAKA